MKAKLSNYKLQRYRTEALILPGFHQMFSEVITQNHQLMNVDPRHGIMSQDQSLLLAIASESSPPKRTKRRTAQGEHLHGSGLSGSWFSFHW